MSRGARALALAAWLALLAVLGLYAQRALEVGTDLRLFLPRAQNPAERLLIEGIGEGPGARMLMVALSGAEPAVLAETSRALVESLAADPAFLAASNGTADPSAIPEALLPARWLLVDRYDDTALGPQALRRALQSRLADLSSPAAAAIEEWIPRDPTLEVLALAEAWQPAAEPARYDGVWFADGRALLVAQTRAPGFDPGGQAQAIAALEAHLDAVRGDAPIRAEVSGPGVFAVASQRTTQADARRLGVAATLGMVVLLLVAYRRPGVLLLGALPLASAALAGLAAVAAVFGTVHGITLAFGVTLIGVAQDYPLHLMSHQHAGIAPRDNARALWPTLATGVASTVIAYLAFFASGIEGLQQLAVFTIAGLAVAALSTRHLLPAVLPRALIDPAASPRWRGFEARIARWPSPRAMPAVLALGAVVFLVASPRPLWQDDLAALSPLPREALARDAALRAALKASDLRHLLVVEAGDAQAVLEAQATLRSELDGLVARGAIAGWDAAVRYVPPARVQRERQARLPDTDAARAMLAQAAADLPFAAEVFEPFVADLGAAKHREPLVPASLAGTPLESVIGGLLIEREGRHYGLIPLRGVRDFAALGRLRVDGVALTALDLKAASESLLVRYRARILAALALAGLLLAAVVAVALRDPARVARVLMPMALTTLLVVALLHALGVPLTLFHLIALVLGAGLGLDYALFFDHAGLDAAEGARTSHALVACALSTLMVFALLASSAVPVLRTIGGTVALAVVLNFVLGALYARPRRV